MNEFIIRTGLRPVSHLVYFVFVSYLVEIGVMCVGNSRQFCTPDLMNMCNITRLSTFVFKKSSENIFVVRSLKGFGWNIVGSASQTMAQHYFTIGPMDPFIRVVAFREIKRQCTRMAVRANMGQSPNSVSMLGQRRVRLTGIETAIGCDIEN